MHLSADDHAKVTAAVREAEKATSGEILTVLAERSDGYSDVMLVYAAAISFTVMSLFALFPMPFVEFHTSMTGGWTGEWSTGEIASLTIALGLIAFLASWALLLLDPVRFFLIPPPIKTARVHGAAIRKFKVGAERRTHGRTGVLLYLSLREHRAEIVADEAIATKVPAEVWGEAMADMLAEIKEGRIAEGLIAGVQDVGEILAEHFPRSEADTNELPDRLIEL